jgi:hypothetical protein
MKTALLPAIDNSPTWSPAYQRTAPSAHTKATFHRPRSLKANSSQQQRPAPRLGRPINRGSLQQDSVIEYIERLFKGLDSESLLIAALSYGLGARLSEIARIRIRDVTLSERLIIIGQREYQIPQAIYDDLKEHIHGTICGSSALLSTSYAETTTFSQAGFLKLTAALERSELEKSEHFERFSNRSCWRHCDIRLRIIGWFHRRSLSANGYPNPTPIDLFDKGPRIVRRERGGVLNSYYLWRGDRLRRSILAHP